ncbi:hypothetical protein ND433_20445 [Clostridioides difficile]|uniref:hypothetical protein n=1 Tax=Clostridioides difficile TaxID=1496 RepID=UPI001C17FE04|nr:hypothetical protein [Clostridioides difficile]MCM4102610.1 hypothetical protein [Clostridioides difficile]MDM9960533.1 hypothetical protein [Clostridioides difficile]HBG5740454.1 hypothetical protein [Clostridioides difficile]
MEFLLNILSSLFATIIIYLMKKLLKIKKKLKSHSKLPTKNGWELNIKFQKNNK